MNYFLLSLIVINSLFFRVEWIRGTITLNSGEEKTGYIKDLKNGKEIAIEYKQRLKDQPTEINSENIKEILLRTSNGSLVAKYLISESIGSTGEYKVAKAKEWMRVAFRGEFDVMCFYLVDQNSSDYYVNWPGEQNARMIYIDDQKGVLTHSKEELLRKSVSTIFPGKCDTMISEVNNDQFNPKGIGDVLRYYVEHCKSGKVLK